MKDKYNREISYLRISVTDLCNLRCNYCMPFEGILKKEHNEIMRTEEILKIVKVSANMGINKVRITGGEPLIKRGIINLCRQIVEVEGIENVSLTTNGVLLGDYAEDLKKAGIKQINISLDTLKAGKYKDITRVGNLEDVLRGIDKVLLLGFHKIKINVVLMADVNDDEIDDFICFADKKGIEVRFIELMPIGEGQKYYKEKYVSSKLVIKQHPELIALKSNEGVADIYQIPSSKGTIGLIHAISCSFCSKCNRIRITADGKLKPCLHSTQEISLKGFGEDEIKRAMEQAILKKPENMEASLRNSKKTAGRNMNEIGG